MSARFATWIMIAAFGATFAFAVGTSAKLVIAERFALVDSRLAQALDRWR